MTTVYAGMIRPLTAEGGDLAHAIAVSDGRIVGLGGVDELRKAHPDAEHVTLDGWLMPGLIEPHGHPAYSAILLSELVVDIRPVTVPDAHSVLTTLHTAIASGQPVFANGWDALLQRGLPEPSMAYLDELAGDVPIVLIHNSGHSAYFNAAAAQRAGLDASTPDPPGASFGRTPSGKLTGVATEEAAVEYVVRPLVSAARAQLPRLFAAHLHDLASRGITMVSDLSWNSDLTPLVAELVSRQEMPVRLRWYEMSRPDGSPAARGGGDDWSRQVGVKTWSDGSPWIGNIATSFPYLDTPATRALGLDPHHIGAANYTTAELSEIATPYARGGWQLACHAHGDLAIDSTLDVYERLITSLNLEDHRFRLEHCGAMTPNQFVRAHALGVTVSIFVDHITYWGEVLVNDLFGDERGGAWADAGAAFTAGHRATFHNDGWVTPNEPFRNMAVAETRTTRSGFRMPGGSSVTRAQSLAAHTTNAAWQLFSDHEVGRLDVGLFADFIVVDRDPLTVSSEELAATKILRTYVGGHRVF